MRLRKDISCTQKLKDGKADDCRKKQHITSPAYPDLLRAQLIPFNHQATPAAFPTLTAQPLCNDISSVQSGLEKKEQQLSEARSCFRQEFDKCLRFETPSGQLQVPLLASETASRPEYGHSPGLGLSDQGLGGARACSSALSAAADDRRAEEETCREPSRIEWEQLSPAVMVAIISSMLDKVPMSRVCDLLGLHEHDKEQVSSLLMKLQEQTALEDCVVYSMQKDQLHAILRTDHTLHIRESPETYHAKLTDLYFRPLAQSLDDLLLMATRAEVNLGERFLAQQGVAAQMAGCWGFNSDTISTLRAKQRRSPRPDPIVTKSSGTDSGYASAIVSPVRDDKQREQNNGLFLGGSTGSPKSKLSTVMDDSHRFKRTEDLAHRTYRISPEELSSQDPTKQTQWRASTAKVNEVDAQLRRQKRSRSSSDALMPASETLGMSPALQSRDSVLDRFYLQTDQRKRAESPQWPMTPHSESRHGSEAHAFQRHLHPRCADPSCGLKLSSPSNSGATKDPLPLPRVVLRAPERRSQAQIENADQTNEVRTPRTLQAPTMSPITMTGSASHDSARTSEINVGVEANSQAIGRSLCSPSRNLEMFSQPADSRAKAVIAHDLARSSVSERPCYSRAASKAPTLETDAGTDTCLDSSVMPMPGMTLQTSPSYQSEERSTLTVADDSVSNSESASQHRRPALPAIHIRPPNTEETRDSYQGHRKDACLDVSENESRDIVTTALTSSDTLVDDQHASQALNTSPKSSQSNLDNGCSRATGVLLETTARQLYSSFPCRHSPTSVVDVPATSSSSSPPLSSNSQYANANPVLCSQNHLSAPSANLNPRKKGPYKKSEKQKAKEATRRARLEIERQQREQSQERREREKGGEKDSGKKKSQN